MIRVETRPRDQIVNFCQRWMVVEFSLFGSILRDDFGPESDVDVLVTFDENAHRSLFDLVQMQDELKVIFGREVDLVSRHGIESSRNITRRTSILSSAQTIYAA